MANQPLPGQPDITPADFPLGRKLNTIGDGWMVFSNIGLAAATGAFFILPSASQGILIPWLMIDASVAAIFQIGTATAINAPSAVTPQNMLVTDINAATFTAQKSTTAVAPTGFLEYVRVDVNTSIQAQQLDWSGMPLVIPAGSTTGFCITLVNNITGSLRISAYVQEYPY